MTDLITKARFASTLGWIQIVFGSTLFMRDHVTWAWIVTGLGIFNCIASAIMGAIGELRDK